MAKRALKVPAVTSPPSRYEVRWVDAIHDNTHDGPAKDAGGIEEVPCLGFHVRTARNEHGRFMVLAMQAYRDHDGENCSRFELSIPVSMIREITPVSPTPSVDLGINLRSFAGSPDGPLGLAAAREEAGK